MSGEPSTVCRRSARLAAKRAEVPRVDERKASCSRPVVEDETLAGPSRCQQTFKKRSATGKSRRVAQQAKKLKTVEEDELVEKAQTKQEYRAQRAVGHLEDAEQRKRGRRKIFAKTSSKREVIASKAPTTTKRPKARAEFVSRGPSRQAKRIRRKSRSTSRGSQESEGVASSSGSYRTAEEISSDAGSTTPEQVDHAPPTPPVAEVESAFDRLRSVWHWLSSNDGIRSSAQNED